MTIEYELKTEKSSERTRHELRVIFSAEDGWTKQSINERDSFIDDLVKEYDARMYKSYTGGGTHTCTSVVPAHTINDLLTNLHDPKKFPNSIDIEVKQ